MSWTARAWEQAAPLYEKILAMPFNQELMKGTLPLEKFKFYMAQDAFYLREFGRALAIIGGRLTEREHTLAFSEFASGAIVVERALHTGYFKTFGVDEKGIQPSPTCMLYTSYLLSKAAIAPVEEAVAAVLPCFWIYQKVGDHIFAHQDASGNNPYREWIDTYAGEAFATSVRKALAISDELAELAPSARLVEMTEAFLMATRLEWMFWDSAYRLEAWEL
ncbi:MAG: thiaminase II [Lunatimonas sp.]|uniref:thiaminase II n=1 Tax=Lunatimonas sp. TaxID=2060141 RepID=UPI00263B78C5|nr:thiaminase II [Lunatimonas sp.]MCC5937290.1 thiaminase II [Lunatimonas sp.]